MSSLENRIRDAIVAFDRDGDGLVNEGEAISCVRACGVYLTSEQETAFVKQLGSNGGLVQPEKLKAAIIATVGKRDPKTELLAHFKKFDRHSDGTIKCKELEEILHTIGDLLTEPEQQGLCKLASKGSVISYKELVDKLLN